MLRRQLPYGAVVPHASLTFLRRFRWDTVECLYKYAKHEMSFRL